MTAFAILFTMAAIGIAETSYLIRARKAAERPVCVLVNGCSKVLESRYNSLFGVHNDLLGLAFYLAMSALTALLVIGAGPVPWWELGAKLLVGGGLVMSAALTFIQWRVLKAWCFWCLMSAGTVLVMALVLLPAALSA
ncbi:hypothetical protein EPO34_01375 [Patescibacteria group bacterium]|nr:MAG: hypothetical protein EPO34_01375 [Patescibacteria group bacterium]